MPPPSQQTQPQPSTQSPPGSQVPFSQKTEKEKEDVSQQLVLLLKLKARKLVCRFIILFLDKKNYIGKISVFSS